MAALADEGGAGVQDMTRSVYVIRITGSFVIVYWATESRLLYVGRGDAPALIAKHIADWMQDVFSFGSDTNIEIQMLRPRRKAARARLLL